MALKSLGGAQADNCVLRAGWPFSQLQRRTASEMEEPKRRKWMVRVIGMGVQASDAKFKGPAGSLLLTVEGIGQAPDMKARGEGRTRGGGLCAKRSEEKALEIEVIVSRVPASETHSVMLLSRFRRLISFSCSSDYP